MSSLDLPLIIFDPIASLPKISTLKRIQETLKTPTSRKPCSRLQNQMISTSYVNHGPCIDTGCHLLKNPTYVPSHFVFWLIHLFDRKKTKQPALLPKMVWICQVQFARNWTLNNCHGGGGRYRHKLAYRGKALQWSS